MADVNYLNQKLEYTRDKLAYIKSRLIPKPKNSVEVKFSADTFGTFTVDLDALIEALNKGYNWTPEEAETSLKWQVKERIEDAIEVHLSYFPEDVDVPDGIELTYSGDVLDKLEVHQKGIVLKSDI